MYQIIYKILTMNQLYGRDWAKERYCNVSQACSSGMLQKASSNQEYALC